MREIICFAASFSLLCAGMTPAFAVGATPGKPAIACDSAAIKAPENTTLTEAHLVELPVKHCVVDAFVTTRDPGPNRVNFRIAFPENWSGRWLFVIPGGSAGIIANPARRHLSSGYAWVTTDKGTRSSKPTDFSFEDDAIRKVDNDWRAAHVVAVASQAITRQYYGRDQMYRYITGCSGGGIATLTEAEWFPEDADGFIPGAMHFNSAYPWAYIASLINSDPDIWISPEKLKDVDAAIMGKYDGLDGATDGLIWDPRKIVLTRDMFAFLSDKQFKLLQLLQTGLDDPKLPGARFDGYWMGNPSGLSRSVIGTTPPPWTTETMPRLFYVPYTRFMSRRGANFNALTDLDYANPNDDASRVRKGASQAGYLAIINPDNLTKFKRTKGKIAMYVGSSEDAVQPKNDTDYSDEVRRIHGPQSADWFKLFTAPGMFHCAGGVNQPTDVPDAVLEATTLWVEQGKVPDFVIATNTQYAPSNVPLGVPASTDAVAKPTRTYRLCIYPKFASFVGGLGNPNKLDVNDANNWECK